RLGSAALGRTHVTDGQVLPFSEVNCDRIRAFLSQALIPLAPQDRNEAFGRAVARVLAHELYHIITRTAHHGSSGVARAAYTVPELMAGDFYFEKADLRALGLFGPTDQDHPGVPHPISAQSRTSEIHKRSASSR